MGQIQQSVNQIISVASLLYSQSAKGQMRKDAKIKHTEIAKENAKLEKLENDPVAKILQKDFGFKMDELRSMTKDELVTKVSDLSKFDANDLNQEFPDRSDLAGTVAAAKHNTAYWKSEFDKAQNNLVGLGDEDALSRQADIEYNRAAEEYKKAQANASASLQIAQQQKQAAKPTMARLDMDKLKSDMNNWKESLKNGK